MPKEYRQGIRRTAVPEVTQASVMPQVVASPVAVPDTGGFNVENTAAGALLKGLSQLNPRLAAWSEQVTQEKRAMQTLEMQEEEKRETARGMAEAYRLGRKAPMPAHQTRSWAEGFLGTQGRMAGIEDGQEWTQLVLESINKPDFDFQKAREDFIKQKQDGLSGVDRHYTDAYISQFAAADAAVHKLRTQTIVKQQEEARNRSMDLSARDIALNPAGPQAFVTNFRLAEAEALNAGATRDDFAKTMVNQLVATAEETGRLDILQLATVPLDERNSWFLAANPQYNQQIQAATKRIIAAKKADANGKVNLAYIKEHAALGAEMDTGKHASIDAAGAAVQRLIDKYPDEVTKAEAKGLIARAVKGVAAANDKAKLQFYVDNPRMLRYASSEIRSDVVKLMEEQLSTLRFEPENIEEGSQKIAEILVPIYQAGGVIPTQLKQFFSFASMEGDGNEPPPAALGAIRVMERMREQGTAIDSRKLMDADDLAVLSTYLRLKAEKKTDGEAWAAAKKIQSPESQDRAKKLWDEHGAALNKKLSSSLKSELRSLASYIPLVDLADMSDIEVHVKSRARENVAAGMTPEDAINDAVTSVKDNVVTINDRVMFVPPTVALDRESLTVGIEKAQENLGDNSKPQISNDGRMVFFSKPDGTGTVPIPMEEIKTLANIEKAGPVATAETAKASENLRTEITGKPGGKLTAANVAALPTDRLFQIEEWSGDAVDRGQMTKLERYFLREEVRKRSEKMLQERIAAKLTFREQHGMKPGPLTDGDVVAVSTAKPGDSGLPGVPNHNEIALKHVGTNPTAALLVAAEGFKMGAYDDPAKGGGRNIAAGYSLTNKALSKVFGDLKAIGVPESDLEAVYKGDKTVSVDQAMALTQRHLRYDVAPRARTVFDATAGKGAWDLLSPGERAALTYLEWSVKGGLKTYPKLMEALKKGDVEAALSEYTIGFTSHGGTRQKAGRAMALAKAMMRGPDSFTELIKKGI